MTRKIYLALLAMQQQDGNLNETHLPPGPQRSYIDLQTQTPERRTHRRTDTRSLVRRPKQHAWNVLPSRAAPRSGGTNFGSHLRRTDLRSIRLVRGNDARPISMISYLGLKRCSEDNVLSHKLSDVLRRSTQC